MGSKSMKKLLKGISMRLDFLHWVTRMPKHFLVLKVTRN